MPKQRKGEEREQAKEPEEDKPPMAAPKGNQFWMLRSSHGRKPIFPTPEALWEACCEYFQWVEDNPLYSAKVCSYQGGNQLVDVPMMRAMTITGLLIFLDISAQAWSEYKQRQDFGDVTTRVDEIIYTQKFSGAAADLLNANIIARDLGLRDGQDVKHSGTVELKSLPDDHLDAKLEELKAKELQP